MCYYVSHYVCVCVCVNYCSFGPPLQIASNEPPPPGCAAFFSVHGLKACDAQDLEGLLETAPTR